MHLAFKLSMKSNACCGACISPSMHISLVRIINCMMSDDVRSLLPPHLNNSADLGDLKKLVEW